MTDPTHTPADVSMLNTITAWPDFGPEGVTGKWSANTYDDDRAVEYTRSDIVKATAALKPAPDPRVGVIAQLVEAGTRLSHKHQPSEGDNLLARQMKLVALTKWNAAIAAAKAVMK